MEPALVWLLYLSKSGLVRSYLVVRLVLVQSPLLCHGELTFIFSSLAMAGKEDLTVVETDLATEESDSAASLQIPLEEHRYRPRRRHAGATAGGHTGAAARGAVGRQATQEPPRTGLAPMSSSSSRAFTDTRGRLKVTMAATTRVWVARRWCEWRRGARGRGRAQGEEVGRDGGTNGGGARGEEAGRGGGRTHARA
jgi:hypothetical protein